MTTPTPLMPRERAPALDLPLVGGGRFALGAKPAESFDMLVFYRGLHCPVCAKYLMELERLAPEFEKRGVKALAISSDVAERAAKMAEKVKANAVAFAFDLPLVAARAWGLYVSAGRGTTSIGVEEPAIFNEPGVFLVKPDGSLYYAATQTMPFARPAFTDLLAAVDFAIAKNYPARGEYAGAL